MPAWLRDNARFLRGSNFQVIFDGLSYQLVCGIPVKWHYPSMIRVICKIRPKDLVAAFVVLFCGGQIAVAAIGITVEKQERILG